MKLGALAYGQVLPAALLTGVRMMQRQGITLEPGHIKKGREMTIKASNRWMACARSCRSS